MSNWTELDQAVQIFENSYLPIVILKCSSIYPCPENEVGLNVLAEMKLRWDKPIILLTINGKLCRICGCITGAEVIEKHLTFSRLMYGSESIVQNPNSSQI